MLGWVYRNPQDVAYVRFGIGAGGESLVTASRGNPTQKCINEWNAAAENALLRYRKNSDARDYPFMLSEWKTYSVDLINFIGTETQAIFYSAPPAASIAHPVSISVSFNGLGNWHEHNDEGQDQYELAELRTAGQFDFFKDGSSGFGPKSEYRGLPYYRWAETNEPNLNYDMQTNAITAINKAAGHGADSIYGYEVYPEVWQIAQNTGIEYFELYSDAWLVANGQKEHRLQTCYQCMLAAMKNGRSGDDCPCPPP